MNSLPGESAPAGAIPDDSAGWALVERSAWHLLEKKGQALVALDLRGLSDVCDFFLVASGNSQVQVKALAGHLQDNLPEAGHRPRGVEGQDTGRWILLDYFDVVVHVFQEEVRQHYQLERLWGDAPRLELDPVHFGDPEVARRHPDLNFTMASEADGRD